MIGKTLGHYQITEKLGEGGMGVVFKARDTHLDRFAAIKVLPPEKVSDPDRKRRFIQEAKAASALNHPNIVTIYDIDQADGIDYIAMEFVIGKTLEELIPRKGIRLSLALKHAIQIAAALARAHDAGIIHRDLKPSNVMVDEHGLVKVLDFGLAKLTEASGPEEETAATRTGAGTVLGTVAYMSPEQAEGKHVDTRSDIFSFGSMLYEMLTGQRAFRGDTRASTIASILREEPKPISEISEALPRDAEKTVRRCLRKDPANRFQHMDDLKVALEELEEESDSGALIGAPADLSPRGRRWRRAAAAAAVVLSVLVATIGTYFVMRRRADTVAPAKYELRQLTSGRGFAALPAASPDGKYIAYVSDRGGNQDLWIQPASGGDPVQLTKNPEPAIWPRFSPDGTRIIFYRRSGIYVLTLVGSKERRLLEDAWTPAFSPDGKWIAFRTRQQLATEIRIMPADGGTTKKLYDAEGVTIWGPVWAPDGSCLLIAEGKEGVAGVVDHSDWKLLPVSGGNPIPVEGMAALRQQSTPFPYPKDWVPENSQVIFGSARRLSHIWRVRLLPDGRIEGKAEQLSYGTREHPGPASRDGQIIPFSTSISSLNIYALPMDANRAVVKGEPAPVLDWDVLSYYPSVTDDGRKMVFVSERGGNFDIWMRDNETKEETPLIASPLQETRALLSHDGKRVAWQRYENRKRRVFWKDLPDGAEKVICDDCRTVLGWTADNSGVIFGEGLPERYSVCETATGKHLPMAVSDPQDASTMTWPIFSPDGKWFAFVLTPERGYKRKLMVSPWRKDRPTRAEEWVQIGTEDDIHHPFWSPDGRVLYYFKYELAERAYCLFGWRFEPAIGKPQGSEIVLRHFHGDLRTAAISSIGFGLAPDVLYLPMWEPEGKVWVAEGPAKTK